MQISELLEKRINNYKLYTPEQCQKLERKEYRDKWLYGIQCFVNQLNLEQRKQKKRDYRFMEIYMKLEHIKEIDDLRWFYKQCLAYKNRKAENTFGKMFWGVLKLR